MVCAVVTVRPPPTPKKESQRRGVRWNEGDMREEPFIARCGAEMGIQIALLALCANLHASMPPTGCTDGLGEGGVGGGRETRAQPGRREEVPQWREERKLQTAVDQGEELRGIIHGRCV